MSDSPKKPSLAKAKSPRQVRTRGKRDQIVQGKDGDQLATLRLTHYRSYHDTTLILGKRTLLIGPNGSGKTNIIEAIRNLSVTKSYRAESDKDTIQWGETYCRIEWKAEQQLEYILTRDDYGAKKTIKYNGSSVPLTQAYGLLPTVLFSPETMQLIDGSPQERRRFLDTILSQADRDYIEALVTYRKVMRERHYVLLRLQQKLGHPDELDFWDSELVRTGGYLISRRHLFVQQLNDWLVQIYPQFRGESKDETLKLHYKPSVTEEDFPKRLQSNRHYDIKTGSTQTGPHRDELLFLLNDRDVTFFASRGELRRCVLSVKVTEALYLRQITEKEPLLLLDDVFSELDAERQASFLTATEDYDTVITTTDLQPFSLAYQANSRLYVLPLKESDGINV